MIAVSEEKAAELIPERPQEKSGQGTIPHEAEADNVYAVTPEEADALIPEAGTRNKPQTPESESKAAEEQDTDTAPVKKSGKRRLKKEVVWALHGMIFAAVAIAIGTRVFATPLYIRQYLDIRDRNSSSYRDLIRRDAHVYWYKIFLDAIADLFGL